MITKRLIAASFLLLVVGSFVTTVVSAEEIATEEVEDILVEVVVSGPPHKEDGVFVLTDESFEHTTQASTGQTTGSWLVWFYGDNDQDDKVSIQGRFLTESEWSEEHVVVASVNVKEGGSLTSKRFQVDPIPSFIYIHKGKMFPYPKPKDGYSWDAITAFCRAPDASLARDIPAPPSFFDHLLTKIAADKTNMIVFGGMVFIMVLGLFFGAVVGHYGNKHKAETTNTKSKDN